MIYSSFWIIFCTIAGSSSGRTSLSESENWGSSPCPAAPVSAVSRRPECLKFLFSLMKTIVCYGDSNTWGANPKDDTRLPIDTRWPGVLQELLGQNYLVISEGLPGRTLVANDPAKPQRTGITHLQAILETHDPIDLVIVMLGTNDIKTTYNLSAEDIANHLEQTIQLIRNAKSELLIQPKILIVCPPSPVKPERGEIDSRMVRYPEIFKKLPELYEKIAEKTGCGYLNAGNYISSSKIDGYHLDSDAHMKLAEKIFQKINL